MFLTTSFISTLEYKTRLYSEVQWEVSIPLGSSSASSPALSVCVGPAVWSTVSGGSARTPSACVCWTLGRLSSPPWFLTWVVLLTAGASWSTLVFQSCSPLHFVHLPPAQPYLASVLLVCSSASSSWVPGSRPLPLCRPQPRSEPELPRLLLRSASLRSSDDLAVSSPACFSPPEFLYPPCRSDRNQSPISRGASYQLIDLINRLTICWKVAIFLKTWVLSSIKRADHLSLTKRAKFL